jgi:hypothetical protein
MVNLPRRAGLGALLSWLGACSAPGEPVRSVSAAPPSAPGMLTPWLTLTGGWRGQPPAAVPDPLQRPGGAAGAFALGLPRPGTVPALPANGLGARLNFVWPVALAARDDAVLVADAGLRQLLRLDRGRDMATPIATLPADRGVALHMAADGSVWLAEPATGQLRQLDRDGRPLRAWRDDRLAARPVAVAWLPEAGGDLLVADAQLAQIVAFDVFGRALRRFGQGRLQSVVAMAAGPAGLYVVDRQAQQVQVFDRGGAWRAAMGADSLVMPGAIAVDRAGRVFVADEADGAIHVFVDGEPVARLGAAALRLSRIDALAVDGNLLYVADSLGSRVQILLITPESLRRPEPGRTP